MPKKRKQARYPPPRHAPLAALDAVVLDLETTGLDVRSDRVIQIAAIPMRGGKILGDSQLDQLINPGMPVPEVARRIHGLGDEDLKDAPALSDFFKTLLGALEGRVVIGHHVRFDLAILRHEAARLGMPWHDPPALDIAVLVGALDPWLPDLGLETITDHFGVTIEGRHSAIGDATATARIFAGLLPRLREMNVRTLGEAQTLTARRADLTLRQAEAGWDSVPEGATVPPREPAPIQVDSYVFERRLKDVMHAPPIFVPAEAMLRQAALSMAEKRIGALLVGAADRPPEGIVTERDLLKAIAAGTDFDR
ncbi:MAG: CBS domain-containing protein, partial [Alphaproteobacteria bacterium]|nr:CBS domain-containing protein [Alphaproteobacteria bacterium]